MKDTVGFVQASGLVKAISGKPALTRKGELFLLEFQESCEVKLSSDSSMRFDSPDVSGFSERAIQQ
jgi:hypothetical protein